MTSTPPPRGLGITAGLAAGLARDLAARCEQLGYHSLWSNDEPAASGLQTVGHFAAAAPRLELGVGVLPLDRHQPSRIGTEIDRLGIDPARLWIGIGCGQLRPQIDPLQRAVAELRERLPRGTRIAVAAMRPRLCRLGGALADGVLLNWMLPDQLAEARRWVQEGSRRGGARRADRRFIRPGRRGLPLAAATPRRGTVLPQRQRQPSQALRGHERSAGKRRRDRIDATGGA